MFSFKSKVSEKYFENLISERAKFEGNIKFNGGLYIYGEVIGNIIMDDTQKEENNFIHFTETAKVESEIILSNNIFINSNITAKIIHATDTIHIGNKANIMNTKFIFKNIIIDKGAKLSNCVLEYIIDENNVI